MLQPIGNSLNKHGIVPFKGENYPDWSFRVQMLLEETSLWHVTITETEDTERSTNWNKSDLKARRLIVDCVDNKCLEYVKEKVCAYDMWNGLKDIYDSSSYTKRVIAFKKLIRLTYDFTDSLQNFFHTFDVVSREYKSAGGTLDNSELIVIMLSCLPDEFNGVVTAISTITEKQFTSDKVRGCLLEEESRIKDRLSLTSHGNETTTAFFNNSNIRCYNCNGRGHTSTNCFKSQRQRDEGNESDYRDNRDNKKKKKKFNRNWNNNYKKPGGSGHVLMVSNENHTENENPKIVRFVLDSGCSDHMTNDLSILRDIKNIEPINISLANKGGSLKVSRIGTLNVKSIVNGREMQTLTISNVHYCENASVNLLSIGSLDEKGVDFTLSKGLMKARRNGDSLFNAEKVGRLYFVNFEILTPSANVANSKIDISTLWHRRLAHLSMQSIHNMKKTNMVKGISNELEKNIDFCDCCVKTKMTRAKFDGTRPQTTRALERIHSDVCGPFQRSYDGFQYYVTFIDDYTHVTNTYLLKQKSEVFQKFQTFCESVESHFGTRVSRLRCDNGGEYTSNAFKKYCANKGILIEYTVPYNPQMNGVSERMNRTICDKTRALLFDSGLSEKFWSEAVLTSTYLTNRSSTVSLKGRTPFELWYGQKPDLSKLRVFGCKAISHVPSEKRSGKVGQSALRGKEYIFVGYGLSGYRLYDAGINKVVMGHSVQFNENALAVTTEASKSVTSASPIDSQHFSDINPTIEGVDPLTTPVTPVTPRIQSSSIVTSTPVSVQTPSTIIHSTPVRSQTSVSQVNNDNTEVFTTPLTNTSDQSVHRLTPRQRLKPFWQRTGEFEMNYACFAGNDTDDIPKNFNDVTSHVEEAEWRKSIDDEVQSLMKNHSRDVVENSKKDTLNFINDQTSTLYCSIDSDLMSLPDLLNDVKVNVISNENSLNGINEIGLASNCKSFKVQESVSYSCNSGMRAIHREKLNPDLEHGSNLHGDQGSPLHSQIELKMKSCKSGQSPLKNAFWKILKFSTNISTVHILSNLLTCLQNEF